MSTKIINITACKEHKFQLPNKLQLSIGFHGENYTTRCSSCVVHGFYWNANAFRPIFLNIVIFSDNNITDVANYCILCSPETLKGLEKDLWDRLVASCPCNLCSFNTGTNLSADSSQKSKPEELMNSLSPITVCFCALSDFNLSGRLSQKISNYQSDYTRNYKKLEGEKSILKDLICDECKKPDINYDYYEARIGNEVKNICETCKKKLEYCFDAVHKRL